MAVCADIRAVDLARVHLRSGGGFTYPFMRHPRAGKIAQDIEDLLESGLVGFGSFEQQNLLFRRTLRELILRAYEAGMDAQRAALTEEDS
jgi:hypothetical protein